MQIQNLNSGSKTVLSVLSLLALMAFLAVEYDKEDVKLKFYEQKFEASKLAKEAMDYLKESRMRKGVFVDVINDPNETALIGQDITPITTDRGYIEAKLTATNPNFAAVVVDMLKEAELEKNDVVAVAFTGSFPGLNIAVHSALQTLKLKPIIITSVGASNWGANDPYYTWLDMERSLYNRGIFKNKSVAASIGGGLDRGRGLSPEGRQLIVDAINRNKIEFINEEHLESSIQKRIELYNKYRKKDKIKAFINVGGGISSIGSVENSKFIPTGFSKILPMKNYPVRGLLIYMAEKNIPVIHLLNVNQLAQQYGLPINPSPLPRQGEGEIFIQKRYSVLLTAGVSLFLTVAIGFVYLMERKRHQLGTEQVKTPQKVSENDHQDSDLLL
ncbi:MAG: poly-gamma-glutamate system protein [Ignavibacteriota bacterium]|nr:MAG: poly-gamma-glutamate system protein [Chlorobiota bacterium]MBE7475387.1 poly-gamma-glutamate system protein [Ignavibacteriales bacterium]MBL1122353.1 poly-gamma-glutamate system protein [Ignavibacteriota bacterium]MCE7854987.1 poly-gamma-glutamate system protein [Ignavibacteria bacterium CHB3]MEB2295160.1 poly-gamma-glutamate system protein [Ignavibacteria bacterium]NUM61054.1 poly-gamma-glutamate system protein [Ignavibacteriaceae bacterium]